MKKSLVSILIAGVLFFSNIGMTSFAVDSGIDRVTAYLSGENDAEEDSKEKAKSTAESYLDEEISYYKITDFTALPENIANQQIRIGAGLETLNFPDSLEVKVEPDLDHEDRIMRKLAQERERLRKEREQEEADAADSASSDDASSEGSSGEEDEDVIIFFGDDENKDDASSLSDEEKDEFTEDENSGDSEYESDKLEDSSSNQNTINNGNLEEESAQESKDEEKEGADGSEDTEESNESDDNKDEEIILDPGEADENGSEDTGLIGWITGVFKSAIVHAAENDDSESIVEPDNNDEDQVSIERVSGVEWILEPEYNDGIDTFSADYEGQIYLFTPVLLIPDNYYIEDELPIITVTVTDEYFPFDEKTEVDGVTIRVRADAGVFPERARVSASKLDSEVAEKVQAAFKEQVADGPGSIVKQYTFDIKVLDVDGNEVEPNIEKGRVFVSFETEEVADETLSAEVYHFIENGENEPYNDESDIEFFDEEDADNDDLPEEQEEDLSQDGEIADYDREIDGENSDLEDVVFIVEKLESIIVDVDDSKAVEAETFSFSTYKVVFKAHLPNEITYELTSTVINLDYYFDNNYSFNKGNQTVPQGVANVQKVVISDAYKEYVCTDKLTVDSERDVVLSDDGTYKQNATGDYCVIVKRLFVGTTIPITVWYGTGTTSGYYNEYTFDLTNESKTGATIQKNKQYPTAVNLSEKEFELEMPIDPIESGVVIYQWQYSDSGNDDDFKDIEGTMGYANSSKYKVTGDGVVNGRWYRCIVDGITSKKVQILMPNSSWTGSYGAGNQCYVSNGTIAYTLSNTNSVFDVVGKSADGSKMLQTTSTGSGWRIFSDTTATAGDKTWADKAFNMAYLYFSFGQDGKTLHAIAKTDSTHDCFAIGANNKLGDAASSSILQESKDNTLSRIVVLGTDSIDKAKKEVNNNTDNIQALIIKPTTTTNLKYYFGSDGTHKPYPDSSTSEKSYEDLLPAVRLGWTGVSDKTVEFDISVGGVSAIEALTPVSKTGNSKAYTLNSNVKTLKLSSDAPLVAYAKTEEAGKVDEKVEIQLRFASGSSNGKTSISGILPTYTKTTTSSSSTSSSTNSSSAGTSTAYSADYFDVNVKNYVDNDKTGKEVEEINDNVVIEISYNFDSKEDIKVYREHDGEAQALSTDSVGSDGTYKIDKDNGKIYVYTKKFSTFAVAYKPLTYYTVTINDGTNTNTVKVKAGEKVAKPADPVKEGYVFKGWFLNGNTSTPYDFDSPVTSNITIKAGWITAKEAADEADAKGDSRAPGTNDTLPVVWLWVLVLIGGVGSFGYSFYEKFKANGGNDAIDAVNRLRNKIRLVLIVVSTVIKFLIKKVKQHKYECMLAMSAVLILISAVTLIRTYFAYHKAEEIYIDVNDEYVEETPEIVEEMANSQTESPSEENADWWQDVSVDVERLSQKYPDVVGWIYFENEDISYPIMYSGDNSKYLSTAYTGEKTRAGAIFIDGETTPDFSDPHSLIYGHNMRNLSMFGRLRYYKTDASYYDEHQYFQVFTKEGVYRYQIFAFEEVPDNHDVFWVYGESPEGMDAMLKEIEKASYKKTGIEATEDDHVITLATCTSNEDKRLIVSAVRTDEHLLASQ